MFLLNLARVSKEYKMLVKNQIPKQKNFKCCQFLKQNFYNRSDFKWIFIKRVRFWIKSFTTRQILNLEFYDASDFEENNNFKKHDLEEKKYF